MYRNPDIGSSFRANNIGRTFYDFVTLHKPNKIIEFGSSNGYSAIAMAMACKDLNKGHVYSYDNWDFYPREQVSEGNCNNHASQNKVGNFVTFAEKDFFDWEPEECDIFVMDMENSGDKITKVYEVMKDKCKFFLFEGGSQDRDDICERRGLIPMAKCGVPYTIINPQFPSLSCISTT
jgi:tRNA A58 N-methylase Trm61